MSWSQLCSDFIKFSLENMCHVFNYSGTGTFTNRNIRIAISESLVQVVIVLGQCMNELKDDSMVTMGPFFGYIIPSVMQHSPFGCKYHSCPCNC